jgi:hypothetical protein
MKPTAPSRVLLLALLSSASAAGCASAPEVLRTPDYTLAHPAFWKVKATAGKTGEATVLTIGRESTMVMDVGQGNESMYESSQADVEVHIVTWPAPAEAGDPAREAFTRLLEDPALQLGRQGRLAEEASECGREFKKELTMFGQSVRPMDLLSKPGWRTILVGGLAGALLFGVAARVPFEQDPQLYCHNLTHMRRELQNVLDRLEPARR